MLIDTSILLRMQQLRSPQLPAVRNAIKVLRATGGKLHIVPQNLIEFWVVATRPVIYNGLGMTPAAAASELLRLKNIFFLLPETPAIFAAWESLVAQHQVLGKPAHDARLVAAMKVHGLTSILTFDRSGFSRFSGIEVVNPNDVLQRS